MESRRANLDTVYWQPHADVGTLLQVDTVKPLTLFTDHIPSPPSDPPPVICVVPSLSLASPLPPFSCFLELVTTVYFLEDPGFLYPASLSPLSQCVTCLSPPRATRLQAQSFWWHNTPPFIFFTPSFLSLSLFPASLRSSMSPWGGCFVSCGGWKEGALTGRPILLLWHHKLTQAHKCFCVQHKPMRVERAGEGGWGWRGCDREREQIAAVLKWSLP